MVVNHGDTLRCSQIPDDIWLVGLDSGCATTNAAALIPAPDWLNRRAKLLSFWDFLTQSFEARHFEIGEYFEMGEATVDAMIYLGLAWGTPFNERRLREAWRSYFAKVAEEVKEGYRPGLT